MTTTEALIRAGQAYMAAACSGNLAGAVDAMRAALAQQPAASGEPVAAGSSLIAHATASAVTVTGLSASIAAKLRDPVAVHAAMLRGEIATPAIRDMLHVYGADALARWDAASGEPAEPLKGWKLNHAQKGPEDGMAEIGYLDPEDDRFSPILTVDTGLYYQADQAMPLAVAILGALADAAPQPAPALVPLTDAEIDAIRGRAECWEHVGQRIEFRHRPFARAVLAAAGTPAKEAP